MGGAPAARADRLVIGVAMVCIVFTAIAIYMWLNARAARNDALTAETETKKL